MNFQMWKSLTSWRVRRFWRALWHRNSSRCTSWIFVVFSSDCSSLVSGKYIGTHQATAQAKTCNLRLDHSDRSSTEWDSSGHGCLIIFRTKLYTELYWYCRFAMVLLCLTLLTTRQPTRVASLLGTFVSEATLLCSLTSSKSCTGSMRQRCTHLLLHLVVWQEWL